MSTTASGEFPAVVDSGERGPSVPYRNAPASPPEAVMAALSAAEVVKQAPTWPAIGKVAGALLTILVAIAGGTVATTYALAKDTAKSAAVQAERVAGQAEMKAGAAEQLAREALTAHREHERFVKTELQEFKGEVKDELREQRTDLRSIQDTLLTIERRTRGR